MSACSGALNGSLLIPAMMKRTIDLKKVAIPANPTEVFALLAVIGGLCITIFLPELPIRLIGVCVAVLGAVGHFMLVSQRISEAVEYSRHPEVSQPTQFRTTVKKDNAGRRVIFDDYETSFGGEDNEPALKEESETPTLSILQHRLEEEQPKQTLQSKIAQRFADEQPPAPAQQVSVRKRYSDPEPDTITPKTNIYDDLDSISEVRIVGKKPGAQAAAPATKQHSPQESLRATPQQPAPQHTLRPAPQRTPTQQPAHTFSAAPPATPPVQPEIIRNDFIPITASAVLELAGNDVDTAVAELDEMPQIQPEQIVPKAVAADNSPGHKRTTLNVPTIDFFEEAPESVQNEPRKELDYLLNRVLLVIRSVTAARTAVFLWVNHDKQQLVLESKISDDPGKFTESKKLPFGTDVVSQIARSGRPEILTEIKPAAELDLIPYYCEPAETLSFIGVPVFFSNSVVGVLCADTTQPDAYDAITVGFFGHFTKLISGLVQSYTGKYDLLQANRALEAITHFRSLIAASKTGIEDVCTALLEAASKSVDYATLGIVVFDYKMSEWKVAQTLSRADITPGALGGVVDLHNSLAGNTIEHCRSVLVSPLQTNYLRATEIEDPMDGGFFASVPLKSLSNNYGALFVEGFSPMMTSQDLAILEVLGEQTGLIIEQMRFNDMLSSMSLVNESRGILNHTAFRQRINEELQRAIDFATPFTLCLVQLDKYVSVDSAGEITEALMQNIIERIRTQVKSYDIVGELDSSTIALGLVGQKSQKVQLWAERIRKEIASSVVQSHNKRFSVTACLGIAEATAKDSPETLMNNAKDALQLSLGRTNAVTVFG